MEDELMMERETITIEGGRPLYNYTFREPTELDQVFAMIGSGQSASLSGFLDQHPDLDLLAPAMPWTPLHMAARTGDVEAIQALVAHGAQLDVEDREHQSTPLGWAAYFAQPDSTEALLAAGATVTSNAVINAQNGAKGELPGPVNLPRERYEQVLAILVKALVDAKG